MHLLGLLGVLISALYLLDRMGIDIGWLNPFAWRRRRAWRSKYEANPMYTLGSPKDVTALLAVAIAKCDGDMTREQKAALLGLFQKEFRCNEQEASALMTSSVFLLRDGVELRENLQKVLQPSQEAFTQEQRESAISLLTQASRLEGTPSQLQSGLLSEIETTLILSDDRKW